MGRNYPDRYPKTIIERARQEPVSPARESVPENPAGYFVQYVLRRTQLGPGRVYTTLDADLQDAAEKAVRSGLRGRKDLEGALVALDVRTGDILALVGGKDFSGSAFDRATESYRSPGSAIKPFVYAAAIERGTHNGAPFTSATWIDPLHDPVDGFRPLSHSGGPGRARRELAESSNGAAVVAAHDAGLTIVRQAIHAATGSTPALDGMMAIGGNHGSGVSPLNLALGYTVFATGGLRVAPRNIVRWIHAGTLIEPAIKPAQMVFSPAVAFIVNDMLKSVVGDGPDGAYGTAHAARRLSGLNDPNIEIRGKTGTGQVGDLWFAGFTPRICVVVWVGSDDNEPLPLEQGYSGAAWALPIWAEFMQAVAHYRPDLLGGGFAPPPGVEQLRIDPAHGCLSGTSGQKEFFLQQRVPAPCESGENEAGR
jgi:membrane carboxypeptidase/penicillin-binding protein